MIAVARRILNEPCRFAHPIVGAGNIGHYRIEIRVGIGDGTDAAMPPRRRRERAVNHYSRGSRRTPRMDTDTIVAAGPATSRTPTTSPFLKTTPESSESVESAGSEPPPAAPATSDR